MFFFFSLLLILLLTENQFQGNCHKKVQLKLISPLTGYRPRGINFICQVLNNLKFDFKIPADSESDSLPRRRTFAEPGIGVGLIPAK